MGVQLVVARGQRAGQAIPVAAEKFIIGRATDCHLKATSELISRYHCAILVGSEVIARDLGSRNGVRLNGERISTDSKVNNGDRLEIGPLEFFVRISADEDWGVPPGDQDGSLPDDSGKNAGEQNATVLMNQATLANLQEQ